MEKNTVTSKHQLADNKYVRFYHTNKCGIRILFAGNSKELHRHLVFRDFLRNNPEAVKKYSAVKEKAAKLFPDDIGKYIAYKSPCIEELYQLCGLIKS